MSIKNQGVSYGINPREVSYIIINLLVFRLFTRVPVLFSRVSGTAAALNSLYSGLIVLALLLFLLTMLKDRFNISIMNRAKAVFGRAGQIIVCVFVILYLAVSAIVALKEVSMLAKLLAFPAAPMAFVSMFFVVAAFLSVLGGIKTVSALHRLFVPFTVAILAVTVISTLRQGNLTHLYPIFGLGIDRLFGTGVSGVVMYTDIVLLFLISPEASASQEAEDKEFATKSSVLCSAAFGIVLTVLIIFAFNVRIPYPVSAEGQFPIFLLLKEVHYGRFFQRIDAALLLAAVLSGMLYLSLNLSLFADAFKRCFNLSATRPLAAVMAPLFFFCVAGVDFIPAEVLEMLLFCGSFGVWAIFIVVAVFVFIKERRSDNSEKA